MVSEGSSFKMEGSSKNLLKAMTSVERSFSSVIWKGRLVSWLEWRRRMVRLWRGGVYEDLVEGGGIGDRDK